MNALTALFAATVLLIGIYAFATAPKKLAVVFLAVIYGGLYFGLSGLMGKPRPIFIPQDEITVIAFHFDEPDWIYVWALEDEPVALRLPWSTEQARQLRQAAEKSKEARSELLMRRGVPEGKKMFYPAPPPEYPPKSD